MLIVRPIQERDLDGLLAMAQQVGAGMTTLKPDRKMLRQRLDTACASFAEAIPAEQRDYLFVLEDSANGELAGVSAIKAAVGLDEPFYNYRVGTLVHSSQELGVFSRMETLYLSNDLTGCSELCTLFLRPAYRTGNNGRLLSKSRFMFIAQFPHLFDRKLIAELRGVQDEQGRAPFWEGLGRHFFRIDFARADDLSTLGKKSFIAELMPRHPLYVAYLPEDARAAIGEVFRDTAPARRLLESEGMNYEGYCDIFDAGPVLQGRVAELRALKESELARVSAPGHGEAQPAGVTPWMVASTSLRDFRVIVTGQAPAHGHIVLNAAQRQALGTGDAPVRVMKLNPRNTAHA
ncbi:arginine N-succinyltransferase [Massilia putida]|uniref:arginine N-succinyltransferase n=1 Tax=Massilia putida TaxID=1141883 RepID=UPI0009528CE4|nr:arginine N-succinyltransferase [Massilia putida]